METAPRVNAVMLRDYVNRNVLLLGKVIRTTPSSITLECSDQGQVQIQTLPNTYVETSTCIEVLGRVESDQSIREISISGFSKDETLDLDLYNQSIQMCKEFPSIFSY